MKNKFNLDEILREVENDENFNLSKKGKISQDDIAKLFKEKDKKEDNKIG